MNNNTAQNTIALIGNRIDTLISVALAASLGIALLFMSGFAQSATLHDAAHDSRHAIGFPCH
ncbi:MAG: CbtB domain-containing protein [Paracoccaceae bacterium]